MSTQTLALIGALTGVVGALTGALSLAWQIIAHRRSGRLVSVTTSHMIPVYGPPHAPEFRDDDQVAVTVSNRGGAPVRARDELTSFSGLWRLRLCYGGPGGVVGAALPGAAAASE